MSLFGRPQRCDELAAGQARRPRPAVSPDSRRLPAGPHRDKRKLIHVLKATLKVPQRSPSARLTDGLQRP